MYSYSGINYRYFCYEAVGTSSKHRGVQFILSVIRMYIPHNLAYKTISFFDFTHHSYCGSMIYPYPY